MYERQFLVCPKCKMSLGCNEVCLVCPGCRTEYPITDGIPIFVDETCRKFWNEYKIDVCTPLLLRPKRAEFNGNIERNEEIYCSAPLAENDAYLKYVDDWKVMLDVGCGDGNMSAPLAHSVETVFCVETSFLSLKRLQRRGLENLVPVNASGYSMPFPDDFFDGVFCIFVIEHVERPTEFLNEIHRVLKPSGHLILVTDSKYFYQYFRPLVEYVKYRRYRKNDPTHVNLMTPRELRNLLHATKFVSEIEDLSFWLNPVLCPKFISEPFLTTIVTHKCKPRHKG